LKRRSNTKRSHDPHELYLDEGVSGPKFAELLSEARLTVHSFQSLLPRNKKVSDARVIAAASEMGYVIVTTDKRMESAWTDEMIVSRARVILLTADDGGPIDWLSALVVSKNAWQRALLDHPGEPLVIKIARSGKVESIVGADDLKKRRNQLLTVRITKAKQAGRQVRKGVLTENA